MNRIKKFDLYLLERFPLLWHTKIIYMLVYSVLISIAFYLWGYLYTDQNLINNHSINRYFELSFAYLFVLTFGIIGITFWALSYFRKNAVKNFYPLQRFYFAKTLVSFILIFWSLTWPMTTFEWGVKQKVKTLVPIENLKQNIRIINLANAFLPYSASDYSFKTYFDSHYPNIQIFERFSSDSGWVDSYDYSDLYLKKGTLEESYYPSNHPEFNDTLNGRIYQFLATRSAKTVSPCYQKNFRLIEKSCRYDQLSRNKLSDLRNYCKEMFDSKYFNYPIYNLRESYLNSIYRNHYYSNQETWYQNQINEQLNSFLDKSSKQDLRKLLGSYELFLQDYEIDYNLQSDSILTYVLKHSENMDFPELVLTSELYNEYDIEKESLNQSLESFQIHRTQNPNNSQAIFFVDQSQLNSLFHNVKKANYPYVNWMQLIVSLGVGMALAFLFLLFALSDLITVLISAPVGGLLIILNVIVGAVMNSYANFENTDLRISSQMVLFAFLMYSLLFSFYRSQKIHARILNITFYLCYIMTIFIGPIILFFLESMLVSESYDKCGHSHTHHTPFHYWLEEPLILISLAFVSILTFTRLIKPIISKPE